MVHCADAASALANNSTVSKAKIDLGQTVTIKGVPEGAGYTITEIPEDYTVGTSLVIGTAGPVAGTSATLQDVAKGIVVNGEFGTLDGMHVVPVPDSYMPDGVLYIIVAKGCCVSPKKIETMRVIADHPDIDGHVVQGRFLYDCFVLAKKANGILVATSAAGGTT